MIIELKNYTKYIKKNLILDNVNVKFESGKIYGLYGINASGKTMLLRAICGLILPSEGNVFIDNNEIGKDIEFPNNVGIIIENMALIGEYTAYKNLELLAKINNIATKDDINNALVNVGLEPCDKRKVKEYSLGMKQRLNIAQAIFEHPKLLLLDEPMNAIDENSVKIVNKTLLTMKEKGCLIIMSSHYKENLKLLCDEILYISNGAVSNEKDN